MSLRSFVPLGVVLAAVVTVRSAPTAAVGSSASAQTRSSDPFALFSNMLPVIQHDRCVNCHGRRDPFSADHHNEPVDRSLVKFDSDGDMLADQEVCFTCHTMGAHDVPAPNPTFPGQKITVGPWKLAPKSIRFDDKDPLQLCGHFADVLHGLGPTAFMHHLESDKLIVNAFVGDRGGAEPTQKIPPPMSHDDFLAAAKVWVDDGGACGPFEGTITQDENFGSSYAFGPADRRTTVVENAKRRVTITLKERSGARAVVGWSGDATMTKFIRQDNCETTIQVTAHHSGDGSGGAGVEVTGDARRHTIKVAIPDEKSTTLNSGRVTSSCPTTLTIPSDTTNLDWPGWSFVIECPPLEGQGGSCTTPAANDRNHYSGNITETAREFKRPDQEAWFMVSPINNSRADDGSMLPIEIATSWDFKRVR